MSKKRIAIIHASAGSGHRRAAEAIQQTLVSQPDCDVFLYDAADYGLPILGRLYCQTYVFAVKYVPQLWGFFFNLFHVVWMQGLVRILRRIYNQSVFFPLHKLLVREQFDVIITTHFLSNEVVSALKAQSKLQCSLVCCVTDYEVHRIWLGSGIDQYCVATEQTAENLKRLGVASEKVIVTGIPVMEKFYQPLDPKALRKQMNWHEDLSTVLIATGSFGIGPIKDIILKLREIQVVVICGHNQSLYNSLKEFKSEQTHIYAHVDNMPDMMKAADLMITKPGGLSLTECLVCSLPMIFFNAIPGQEEGNIRSMANYRIGYDSHDVDDIVKTVYRWLADPVVLNMMKERMHQVTGQNSAQRIVDLALQS